MVDPKSPDARKPSLDERAASAPRSVDVLNAVFDCSDIGAWTYDISTKAVWFSPVVFRQIGLPPDAFEHSFAAFDEFILDEHFEELRTAFRALIRGESARFSAEVQVRHADGGFRWIESTARRVELSSGPAICGAHVDITERIAAQRLLAERLAATEASERRFIELAEHHPGIVFEYIVRADGAHEIGYVNARAQRVWEVEADTLCGDPTALWEMVVAEDRPALEASVAAAAESLAQWRHRWRIVTPSGREKHLEGRATPTRMADGGAHFNTLILDVTEQVRQAAELEAARRLASEAHDRLSNAIEALPDGFVIYDADDRIALFNSAFREIHDSVAEIIEVGLDIRTLLNRAIDVGLMTTEGLPRDVWIETFIRERREGATSTTLKRFGNGRWIQRRDRLLPNGELVGVRTDLSDLKAREEMMRRARDDAAEAQRAAEAANARAEYEAIHDPLTMCANRRGLMRRFADMDADPSVGPALMFSIDLDRFKAVNDTYGHAAGDAVLKHVAERIRTVMRPGDFLARKGGDEFVVIAPDDGDAASGAALSERIIAAATEPLLWKETELRVGVSVGFARAEHDAQGCANDGAKEGAKDGAKNGPDAARQLSHADMALAKAKQEGRNRSAAFHAPMAAAAQERLTLAADLKRAVEHGELVPFFQPQIHARCGRVRGVEALARWRHPERGFVPPNKFFPIADELKLTSEIDHQILAKSIDGLRALRAQGLDLETVSVNVSAKRLRARTLIAEVAALEADVLRSLSFEVLETVFADPDDDVLRFTIDVLKELGVSIELDDFGSGHASVASIIALRPEFMKLDQIFAVGLDANDEARAVLRSLIGVARSFNIGVVAEGVETDAQRAILAEEGCDVLQGYGIARPMPFEDLVAWLRHETRDSAVA